MQYFLPPPVFLLLYQELIFQALALTCGAVITDYSMEEGQAAAEAAAAAWAPQPFLQPFMQPGTMRFDPAFYQCCRCPCIKLESDS